MQVNNTNVRWGNLLYPMQSPTGVKLPMYGFPVKVFEAHFEGAKVAFKIGESFAVQETPFYGYSMLCGIRLDETWLTAFGFAKIGKCWIYENPETKVADKGYFPFQLEEEKQDGYTWLTLDLMPISHLTYVHELQNLFFAVTRNELKLNIHYLHLAGIGKLK